MYNNVCVIGLGKLGLCLAAVLAENNRNVIGIDVNKTVVDSINLGKIDTVEYMLAEKVKDVVSVRKRLVATQNYTEAIGKSGVIFIIVPTNSLDSGRYYTGLVADVASKIAPELKNSDDFKVINLVSTVLPGDTQKYLIDILEKGSGKKCGKDFGVCYNPEFIALGKIIKDMYWPDSILIGTSDDKSGNIIKQVYNSFVCSNPKTFITTIQAVELAKISVNVFVTMKMAFGEVLSEMCEKLPGCDIDDIVNMVGADGRIGRKYLDIGTSYGGPCFPRDNRAFGVVAQELAVRPLLSQATDSVNHLHNTHVCDKALHILGDDIYSKIAVLGMTYKPDTDVIEESASVEIVRGIVGLHAYKVVVYDPSGTEATRKIFGNDIEYADKPELALLGASLAIAAVKWRDIEHLTTDIFKNNMKVPNVLDCWRMYNANTFKKAGINYYCIGRK